MSHFYKETRHPETGEWQMALWIDDCFGKHLYGAKFPDGKVFDPRVAKLDTKEESPPRASGPAAGREG